MNSYEYIKEVKKNAGLETDYAVAKLFGWSPQKIYQYRDGQGLGNNEALQVAEVLGVEVITVIADMEVQRAKTQEVKNVWARISKMRKEVGAASPNLLIFLGFCTAAMHKFYILCQIRKDSRLLVRNVIVHTGT